MSRLKYLAVPALALAALVQAVPAEAHGCHRSCEWGPGRGFHRHVGPYCRPILCRPRAVYPGRCWVDGWGVRHCRW
ncbi:MAG: hypothetical protein ACK4TP_15295 [Hyphomicrobium sp.]|jgi:hypothetical protein